MSLYSTVIINLCWISSNQIINGRYICYSSSHNDNFITYVAVPEITLTSSPPPSSNGYFCPGPVQFTCVGTEINVLTWRINNTYRVTYNFISGDTFPQPLSSSPLLPDVNIMITSGSDSRIESTLNAASVSNLRGTLIECLSLIGAQYESNATVHERQGTEFINI